MPSAVLRVSAPVRDRWILRTVFWSVSGMTLGGPQTSWRVTSLSVSCCFRLHVPNVAYTYTPLLTC
jgi:hypothetical protein